MAVHFGGPVCYHGQRGFYRTQKIINIEKKSLWIVTIVCVVWTHMSFGMPLYYFSFRKSFFLIPLLRLLGKALYIIIIFAKKKRWMFKETEA